MRNLITKTIINKTPALYATEGQGFDAKVTAHFFNSNSDWYMTEYDADQRLGFGYVILNGDYEMSELGYFSLDEFERVNRMYDFRTMIERDLYFKPDTLANVLSEYEHIHGLA